MAGPNFDPTQEVSKYNEASFQILRLHDQAVRIETAFNRGELIKVKYYLDRLYTELYPDICRLSSKEEKIKENIKLRQDISTSKTSTDLYDNLMNRQLWLKEVQDAAGKGGVYQDAFGNDFD